MKVGDVIKLSTGAKSAQGIESNVAILCEKLPREDRLEYDWRVFADGQFFDFGRQIEDSMEIVSEVGC